MKHFKTGALLLGATILLSLFFSIEIPGGADAGLPYLISAACVGLFYLLTSLSVQLGARSGISKERLWQLRTRVRVFFYVAWQLVILAEFNIWANHLAGSTAIFAVSCICVLAWIIISDRVVSLADSPSQTGGSKPINFFGKLRRRRIFFWSLIVYPTVFLVILGAMLFAQTRQYPTPFKPPQLFLLFAAVVSAGAAGLVYQRYRGLASGRGQGLICVLGVLLVLGFAGLFEYLLKFSLYTYVISSLALICIALSAQWLLRSSSDSAIPSQTEDGITT